MQINDIFAAVGAPATAAAYASVTATVPVVAYASVVDNRTGDPVAVIAEPAPHGDADLLLPGVARASGVGDSLWRTDVKIFGAGESSGTVTMAYHPKNREVTNPTSVSLAIGPGRLLALDDVMSSAFSMTTANGALRITADVPLMVLARTYNQSPNGTYGQSISADPFDNLIEAGQEAFFSGVQGGDFRSNALFFNGGSAVTEVELELVAADGTVEGIRSMTLMAGETDQINDVLAFFDLPKSGAPHTLKVSPTSGGPVSAGVSTIDGDSGDPSYEDGTRYPSNRGYRDHVCLDIELWEPGLVATYNWAGIYLGGSVEGEMVREHVFVGMIEIPTVEVVTSTALSFDFNGIDVSFTTDSVDQYVGVAPAGNAVLLQSYSEVSGTTGGVDLPLQTYTVTYAPPQFVGPVTRFCEGEAWFTESVTETTVTTSNGETSTVMEPTLPYYGSVLDIDEEIVTPAGTFPVIHVRYFNIQAILTDQLISIEHGVLIRQVVFAGGDDGVVLSAITATEITPPIP